MNGPMKRHPLDLVALLFGLAFTIAGAAVIVAQATTVDVSPQWAAAVALIALGMVALAVTVVRATGTPTADETVSPAEPAE